MTMKTSTGLRDSMLDTESFRTTFQDGKLMIFSTPVPADADAAETGTLLVTIWENNMGSPNGLDWEAAAVAGVLSKLAAQTWSQAVGTTGVAAYYRFVKQADTGVLSTTEERVQGDIALVGSDLNLSNLTLTSPTVLTIDSFSILLPTL